MKSKDLNIGLVCTSGGHFEQMLNLSGFYENYPHFWITSVNTQTEYTLKSENCCFINMAHFKKPWTYLFQISKVMRIFLREKPTHLVSTGSGRIFFIPFLLSILFGSKVIFIDTFSHVMGFTKMGALLYKLGYPVLSQWESPYKKRAVFIGPVMTSTAHLDRKTKPAKHIFVTLGTRAEPFPRALQAVEKLISGGLIKEKVIVQAGHTKYRSELMEIFDFCTPPEMDDLIFNAKFVLTQESAGIVTKCLKYHTRFVVVPRDYAYKELPAKSDMREDLHYKLEELGFTFVAHNGDEIRMAIEHLDMLKVGFVFDNTTAIAILKDLVEA